MKLTHHAKIFFLALAYAVLATQVRAMSWEAKPIEVHEWGVNSYDWSPKGQKAPKFPQHIYTPGKPGKLISHPQVGMGKRQFPNRVKDMAADGGIRYKPVLYFYPPSYSYEAAVDGKIVRKKIYGSAPVGIEMRFRYGSACAWYPQISKYRTPDETAMASAVDWDAWKSNNDFIKIHKNFGGGYARPSSWGKKPPLIIPDDKRFELVWDRVTLNPRRLGDGPMRGLGSWEQPELTASYAGKNLPENHWIKIAREVDAPPLTNGKEIEKYLFYEGITSEQPAISVVRNGTQLVNVSPHPIYDIYLIYNHHGKRYVRYFRELKALPGDTWRRPAPYPLITIPSWDQEPPLDDNSFHQMTSNRLITNMTQGEEFEYYERMRDPADPQRPTLTHQLYPKEAMVVEKIWRDTFFNRPGLTILYRESPAYLDEAMPLNIYTDMYHYIKLARCGWVVNHNMDLKTAGQVEKNLRALDYPKQTEAQRRKLRDYLKKHKLHARGQLMFHFWMFNQERDRTRIKELEKW